MDNTKEITLKHWLQLIFLGVVWGSSFILIKRALLGLDAIQVASFRVGIACLAFLPFLFFAKYKIDWTKWPKFFLVGLTTTGIPSFCFAIAQTHVASGTAGILNSLTPIFTLLVGIFVFKAKFQWSKLIGVFIGFIGAGLLMYNSGGNDGNSNVWYCMLILFATICYGFNANLVKHFFPDTNSITVSAGAFILVGFPAVLYLLFNGDFTSVFSHSSKHTAFYYVIGLSLLCTVIANVIFYNLVQSTNAVFASTVTFLIPLFATVIAVLDGEKFTSYHAIAMVCILIAIAIIRRK